MDYMKYLKDVDAQKQIDKLARKLGNKKVIFYGVGEYFDIINENYDLSNLNVAGVADLRFAKQANANITQYPSYAPEDLKTLDYDVILITVFEELFVLPYIKQLIAKSPNKRKQVSVLIKPTLSFFFKTVFCRNDSKYYC